MNIQSTQASISEINVDAIVVGVWDGEPLEGAALELDQASGGRLAGLILSEEVSCSSSSVTLLYKLEGVQASLVAVVGQGKKADATASLAFQVAGAAAKTLAAKERSSVAYFIELDSLTDGVCGSMVGCQGQDLYRAEKKLHPPESIMWKAASDGDLQEGMILGRAMNLTRELVNRPANDIYPETLAARCEEMAAATGVEIEVWDEEKLAREKCGSLMAVAQGSDRPPRLVVMKYSGGPADQKPLALVGKGVTFDSGGLSLKPSDAMMDMKCDMAGSATVIGAVQAIAELKLKVNVIGVIGAVENMVSGRSYKLGDVVTARSGKTIEIHNTDAEGRLVLADALNVAVEKGAGKIVDLATLTGACMVALGRYHAGLMSNNQEWCDAVSAAAANCGEPVWQLPMAREFGEAIKSSVADIKNVGDGRWGGAMTAAKLLEEFVEELPWTHMDIAGPSFGDKPRAWIDAGASGSYVRTLVELARNYN